MTKQVWIVFTKSKALDGCSIDMDRCDFYFSEIYVPADNEEIGAASLETILTRVKQSLLEDKLVLIDVSKCLRYRADEWPSETALDIAVHNLAERALTTGSIQFSSFRSEEIEALCRYKHKIFEITN